jgi:uncharacterized protein YeaO (DUF488 family)
VSADKYDVWMANLGPSEKLLYARDKGGISWPEFKKRYRAELRDSGSADNTNIQRV